MDSAPPSDRRAGERHLACFPASLERPDGANRPSIIHDLSEQGALLLMRTSKLSVGDEVNLHLYITDDPTAFRPATGRVVRIEPCAGQAGPWQQRVAVQFTAPIAVHADEIERFREVAARFGIR